MKSLLLAALVLTPAAQAEIIECCAIYQRIFRFQEELRIRHGGTFAINRLKDFRDMKVNTGVTMGGHAHLVDS